MTDRWIRRMFLIAVVAYCSGCQPLTKFAGNVFFPPAPGSDVPFEDGDKIKISINKECTAGMSPFFAIPGAADLAKIVLKPVLKAETKRYDAEYSLARTVSGKPVQITIERPSGFSLALCQNNNKYEIVGYSVASSRAKVLGQPPFEDSAPWTWWSYLSLVEPWMWLHRVAAYTPWFSAYEIKYQVEVTLERVDGRRLDPVGSQIYEIAVQDIRLKTKKVKITSDLRELLYFGNAEEGLYNVRIRVLERNEAGREIFGALVNLL